jgi:methylase of polypeptide subunit release factors
VEPEAQDAARAIAQVLRVSGYTVENVNALLGDVAAEALGRNVTVPARRALDGDESNLALLVKLFLLGDLVPTAAITRVFGGDAPLGDVLAGSAEVRSVLEIAPYAVDAHDWLIASDWSASRTGKPVEENHVLGVGGASAMLAQSTVRMDVARALDIGTGCGVQAFHLAEHADQVIATDTSSACVTMAAMNAAMNDVRLELRAGSLFDPVAGERFDLIVSNPPFVIGSPEAARHRYRDSGMVGDRVCAELVRRADRHLTEGGFCQLLANWEITVGDDWAHNPRSWLADSSLDAWVIQRDVQDPADYVETWLRDAGDHLSQNYDEIYQAWLAMLEARGVLGIGFGFVTLRRGGHDMPVRRFEHAGQPVVQPIGPDVARWFEAQDLLRRFPGAEVLTAAWTRSDDVQVLTESKPGAAEPDAQSVRRSTGLAWTNAIDDFGVDLLAAAVGEAPLGTVIVQLATARGVDPQEVLAVSVPLVHQMVAEGFLRLSR